MSKFRRVFLRLLSVIVLSGVVVVGPRAEVFVAKTHTFSWFEKKRIHVKARNVSSVIIPVSEPTRIHVTVDVLNAVYDDLNVWICDESAFLLFMTRQTNNCRGIQRGRKRIQFVHEARVRGPHRIVLDNTFSRILTKKAVLSVRLEKQLSDAEHQKWVDGLNVFLENIKQKFKVPEFDFALRSCGTSNAFSDTRRGHITLCSELVFGLMRRNLTGAIEAIFFHELGHTLLNLWGLPNWDNEESVDEFAIVMLLWQGRQEKAIDWIRYYGTRDSGAEASQILRDGDRHPLSIQRARNIERILRTPKPVVSRWNKLLYPHLTDAGLKGLIDNPGRFHERDKLKAELKRRL